MCARNFEYFSEDPLISGLIAAAIVNGVESKPGRMTTLKHLACNNQETNRYFSNSLVSDRAKREIYLKGFALCIGLSRPSALMTSYHLLGGEHACNRQNLLPDVLRGKWGYDGLVMPDRDDILAALNDPSHAYALTRGHLLACAESVLQTLARLEQATRKETAQHEK